MAEEIIFRAEIAEPPVSVSLGKKDHYLTANIFYGGVNPFVRSQVVKICKTYLLPFLEGCPLLHNPPYSSVIQYISPKDIDLDNKCFFWRKIIHDMLGEKNKSKHDQSFKLSKVKDDTTKYFDCNGDEFYSSSLHKLIFLIIKSE